MVTREQPVRPRVPEDRPEYQSRPELRSVQSFPQFRTIGEPPKSGLERFLSHFADVRAGEGPGVLLLALNVFLLLFAYYLLKTVRETLILTEGGAVVKAYSSGGQALLLMGLVPLYGYIATKIVRIKLLLGMLGFFILNLAIFYLAGIAGVREGVAFFIWVGIFNVFVISQVWAFANDLYTEGQGKRLFPLIGIGSSLGAWLGAQSAERMVSLFALGPYQLQLIAAVLLGLCGVILVAVNRVATKSSVPEMASHAEQPLGPEGGFSLVFRSRYLLLIAGLTLLLNVVNSSGEFLLGSLVSERAQALHPGDVAAQRIFVGSFYGSFFAIVNLLGFLLQAFGVSRIFKHLGVRQSLFVLPVISLFSYSILAFVPLLGLVRAVKTVENATDYSLQNTLRQALFLPTSREAKYKAKAAIDTFFMRAGDVLQAGVVGLGTTLHFAFTGFAWLNVGFTLLWLTVAAGLARQHRKMGF
ncbi:MAG: NTP/NDP exchange transporter [Candidatus Korobacteraceae bacterium]